MIWTIRVQSEITANFLFPAAGFPNGVLPELPRIARILGGCISVRKRSARRRTGTSALRPVRPVAALKDPPEARGRTDAESRGARRCLLTDESTRRKRI